MVSAQQGVWLETGIQTEMKMSLKLFFFFRKKKALLEVQENAVEAVRDSLARESGKPSYWLQHLHKDSLPRLL